MMPTLSYQTSLCIARKNVHDMSKNKIVHKSQISFFIFILPRLPCLLPNTSSRKRQRSWHAFMIYRFECFISQKFMLEGVIYVTILQFCMKSTGRDPPYVSATITVDLFELVMINFKPANTHAR